MPVSRVEPGESVAVDGSSPAEFNLDPYAGLYYGGKPILGFDGILSHLYTGRQVHDSNGVITYSFNALPHATGLFNNPNSGLLGGADYSPFSPEQQDAARAAIQLWDDLIPQSFHETNGRGADIVFANSSDPAQAFAYYPVPGRGFTYQSDVFVADPTLNPSNTLFHYGQYGNTTLIHELGHTLGLSHPGNYNGTGTFSTDAEYAQDTNQYTIMSYFNGTNSGAIAINWNMGGVAAVGPYNPTTGTYAFNFYPNYPQGPMLHDILAIQTAYGADPTTRADGTTYGFHSTAGNALYDFNSNPFPNYSIYDAGGNDTIDASGFNVSQFIDLHPGSFSSIGGGVPSANDVNAYWTEYYAAYGLTFPAGTFTEGRDAVAQQVVQLATEYRIERDTGVSDITTTQFDNVSIAYNTIIENAIGGSARDLLWGNDARNVLSGMAGDDVLNGFGDNDRLVGGLGNDTLTGGAGDDVFVFAKDGSTDKITDFQSGHDKIDLTSVSGVSASDVHFDAVHHQVMIDTDHDGTADMFITVLGNAPGAGDYIFA